MKQGTDREIDILLVEDNPADVRLLQEALAETKARYRLHVVTNGEEAIDFVFQRGGFQSAPRPHLILLDFNLPRKNGADVLEELKREPRYKKIPVVVITSSRSDCDVNAAYERGANCYLRKPNTLEQIYDLANTLSHHWLELALLPPVGRI
jgi:two-component system, chemotaxis family, response regulator Rcp1